MANINNPPYRGEVLREAAQRVIPEVELLKLSSNAQEQFISLLLEPPRPAPGLARAFKRHRSLIGTK
jgi:uncharacterized protein (DUF1778 family)